MQSERCCCALMLTNYLRLSWRDLLCRRLGHQICVPRRCVSSAAIHAGENFAAVLGAQQSALEAVLLKRHVMGPSWLTLACPTRVDTGAQVTQLSTTHSTHIALQAMVSVEDCFDQSAYLATSRGQQPWESLAPVRCSHQCMHAQLSWCKLGLKGVCTCGRMQMAAELCLL